MKLHSISLWAVAVIAATFAAVAPANAQTNILVMNEERILRDSAAGLHIATRLTAIQAEMDTELRAVAEPVQQEIDAFPNQIIRELGISFLFEVFGSARWDSQSPIAALGTSLSLGT